MPLCGTNYNENRYFLIKNVCSENQEVFDLLGRINSTNQALIKKTYKGWLNLEKLNKVELKSKKESIQNLMKKRTIIQIILAVAFLALNFMLFFVTRKMAYIPLVMIPLMIISVFIWSRGFCGWACPRAAFLERFIMPISLKKPVPKWIQNMWVSVLVFVVLISRVTYVGFTKGLLAAGFLLCVVPTIGALLVAWYSPKSWCAICPTGTLMKFIDLATKKFKVRKNDCTNCGICDKACLMGIEVSKVPNHSFISQPNCTQCSLCVAACPTCSIELPHNTKRRSSVTQSDNAAI